MVKVVSTQKPDAFLGTGWGFPPTFSRTSLSVEMVSGEVDIHQSLWILFSTRLGERVMLPKYGAGIWRMVFASINTSLITQMQDYIREAIVVWEPRIDVDLIEITPDNELEGKVLISLSYTIRSTNARNNLVYPFYLQEGTLVGSEL